jgi:hypothetical protein
LRLRDSPNEQQECALLTSIASRFKPHSWGLPYSSACAPNTVLPGVAHRPGRGSCAAGTKRMASLKLPHMHTWTRSASQRVRSAAPRSLLQGSRRQLLQAGSALLFTGLGSSLVTPPPCVAAQAATVFHEVRRRSPARPRPLPRRWEQDNTRTAHASQVAVPLPAPPEEDEGFEMREPQTRVTATGRIVASEPPPSLALGSPCAGPGLLNPAGQPPLYTRLVCKMGNSLLAPARSAPRRNRRCKAMKYHALRLDARITPRPPHHASCRNFQPSPKLHLPLPITNTTCVYILTHFHDNLRQLGTSTGT